MYKKGTQATSIYSIGKGGAGVFRPVYRTPPFDKGKLLFPLWKYGVKIALHPCRSFH